jgi:hypothetical protein
LATYSVKTANDFEKRGENLEVILFLQPKVFHVLKALSAFFSQEALALYEQAIGIDNADPKLLRRFKKLEARIAAVRGMGLLVFVATEPGFVVVFDFVVPDFAVPDFAVPDFAVPDFAVPDFAVPWYYSFSRRNPSHAVVPVKTAGVARVTRRQTACPLRRRRRKRRERLLPRRRGGRRLRRSRGKKKRPQSGVPRLQEKPKARQGPRQPPGRCDLEARSWASQRSLRLQT